MAGGESSLTLPESFVARLLERLRACDQPLIRLWAWPWSGKRRLLEILSDRRAGRWVFMPPRGGLTDQLSRLSRPGPAWLVAEDRYDAAELLAAAEALRPEQRLILKVERRRDDEVLPERWIGPPAMRLRPAEIEEMFAGAGGERVEQLARATDGWLGPLLWLRDRGSGEAPEGSLAGSGFAGHFDQRVLNRLDAGVIDAVREISLAGELEAGLWRRAWLDRPEMLAALERLISQWALVVSEAGGVPRLPRPLTVAARARDLPPSRRRELFTRLGLAARALGDLAAAERYLRLAGDDDRLRRLASSGAQSPRRVAGDAGVESGGRRAKPSFPRFSLQLLGQPVVRRLDAGGEERGLDWRLRRAFLSLAYLALAPDHRATKEQLVDALWRDVSETSLAKNFHPALSEARRTLGHRKVFVYNQGLYTLNPDFDWWIDSERFVERIRQGRRLLAAGDAGGEPQRALDAWHEAWRLYRGELLAGVDADWIRSRRQALQRQYVELLCDVGDLSAGLGQVTRALDAYRSVLLEEPFEERIHLAVMELYARQGRRDLVRRQFVRMQELLLDELNVEPREETRERYHQLMR